MNRAQRRYQIKDVMIADPATIDSRASVEEALALMSELDLRHLPVTHEDRIVGVLSERDIARAQGAMPRQIPTVEKCMTHEPFTVDPEEDLERTLEIMASNKLGCVLVRAHGARVAGIFTTTDAVRLLASMLAAGTPLPHPRG